MQAATESVAPFLRCKDAAFLGQACRELVSNPVLRSRYSAPTREAQFNQDVRDVAAAAAVTHTEHRRRIAEDPNRAPSADAESSSDSREYNVISDSEANRRLEDWLRWQHDPTSRVWSPRRGWHRANDGRWTVQPEGERWTPRQAGREYF